MVARPFPLPTHPNSKWAAVAAACAWEAGKYWEYREAIFSNQSYYREGGDAAFKATAARLNITGFDGCFDAKKFLAQIETSISEGKECGIYGTPTFFVDGKAFVGKDAAAEAKAEVERLLGVA